MLLVEYLVKSGLTYTEVSDELQRRYPGCSGLSSRSVRRYCKANSITHLTNTNV